MGAMPEDNEKFPARVRYRIQIHHNHEQKPGYKLQKGCGREISQRENK